MLNLATLNNYNRNYFEIKKSPDGDAQKLHTDFDSIIFTDDDNNYDILIIIALMILQLNKELHCV